MQESDPFEYYITPKNNWELIWWAFSDEHRLTKYKESLNLTFWRERRLLLWVYFRYLLPVVLAVVLPLWVLGLGLVAGLDLPTALPAIGWKDEFLKHWHTLPHFFDKWLYLLSHQYGSLVVGLLVGLVAGLLFGLVGGLGVGLLFGLAISLGVSLSLGLVNGLDNGLLISFVYGSVFGLAYGSVFELVTALILVLIQGLIYGFTFGLTYGYIFVLGIFINYLFLLLQNIRARLSRNAYLIWGNIDLSLFLEAHFIRQTQENPILALKFALFLFAHKRSSHNLAGLLAQVGVATVWKMGSLTLKAEFLEMYSYEIPHFSVPDTWFDQIEKVHQSLVANQLETQITIKKRLFQEFVKELEKMYKLTLTPFPYPKSFWGRLSVSRNIDWYKYYREAIEEWLHTAKQELENIIAQASLTEPMAANVYKIGNKLTPIDQTVFIERRDLRNRLSRQLYTTNDFSVLFLQGQRRVGKSSLINFFPQLLGSRFEVVYLSLEGNIKSVPNFLQKLHDAFIAQTRQKQTAWEQPEDWSDALHALYKMINEYAQPKERHVILAIDEYEYLHPFLQAEPERGRAFLGTFRHYLQGKGSVSLMWIGLHFFSELQSPNWNEAFVNVVRIEVPYLTEAETYQLIEVAQLAYPNEVKAEIFRLTQGHPALVQKICFAIVDIANRDGRRAMTEADLQEALKRMIYIQDNNVTDVFWSQVCQNDIDRAIVWAVRESKPVPRTVRHRLRRLEEYGFIIPAGEGYKIRVPIFEYWIDNFTQYFDLEKMEV